LESGGISIGYGLFLCDLRDVEVKSLPGNPIVIIKRKDGAKEDTGPDDQLQEFREIHSYE
jgi:hypothetical protein